MSETTAAGFQYLHTVEPHHRRRVDILKQHPAIRRLSGFDRRTVLVTIAVVVAQLAIAWTLTCLEASVWSALLAAALVGAVLSHWAGQTIHETAHHLACRTPAGNRLLALFANLPMLFPIAATFHRYHLDHHRFLGVEGRDTDLPHPVEVRLIGRSRLRKALWLVAYFFVYAARGLTFVKRPDRAEVLNLVLQLAANVLIAEHVGAVGVAYLAASTVIGHSWHPVAAHFIHEHYTFSPGQETFSYYGPLNWVTFNVGYHVEHHDFMNVPGWRLPELHAIAAEHYQGLASHRSWTAALWAFVSSRTMGVASRLVRTERDFARGRGRLLEEPLPAWPQVRRARSLEIEGLPLQGAAHGPIT